MNLSKPQIMIYNMIKTAGDVIANNCSSMLIAGHRSESELQTALNELFKINDALRFRLRYDAGEVYQELTDFTHRDFEVLHFADKLSLDAYADEYSKQLFDSDDILCDFKIIILPDSFGLIVKLHHLISDAWTFGLLYTQFNSILNGKQVTAYSYADYLETEKSYSSSKRYLKDRDFFCNQIKQIDHITFLNDKKTSDLSTKRKVFILDSEKATKINSFASENNCSVFSVFSLALAIYISKVKINEEQFFIGTTILNRHNERELNTAGVFINTVPLLFDIDSNDSFMSNLEKTEDSLMSVFRHQKYNYNDLLSDMRKENRGFGKIYDVMINYMNATIDFTDECIHSSWYHNGMQIESLQIQIDDRDREGIFKIHYDYQTEKFTDYDIDRLHNHICAILDDALSTPDKKISDLDILSDKEKNQLVYEFNSTPAEYENKCVHQLFEEQAVKTPDKTALVASDKEMTYGDVNADANRIANALINKGIGKGDIVGVKLPRKSYFISTILGVLKTGAAYIPIDPELPDDRIDYMLTDSSAKICISDENISELLNEENTDNPDISTDTSDPCYCIYTSGSTGKPKGTVICHKNLIWYLSALKSTYGAENINMPFFTSQSVDLSVTSMYFPIVSGGTIYMYAGHLLDSFKEIRTNDNLTLIKLTPTHIDILCKKSDSSPLLNLKHMIVGGETLSSNTCKKVVNCFGQHIKIHNEYGPTETTVGCADYVYNPDENDTTVSIGKPLPNVQMYILDKHSKLVPIGVTGELCVAGDGVGSGYLGRPELTAEKFIDNPFGKGKLYKTGDLAYHREDGNIVFVGRNDFQVKIRGLRIELGEIENAISDIDGIVHSVAVVRKDNDDHQLICAFYTGNELNPKDIRSILSAKLPKYMVPHIFIHLDEMPLTSSGKIDRNALPEAELNGISSETEYQPPITKEEIALSDAVCSVLEIESINMLDNFFNIGGDSINAIYIVSSLEESGYELHVADIMQKDTFSDVAKAMKPIFDKAIYDQSEVNGLIPFSPIMHSFIRETSAIPKDFQHNCIIYTDCDEYTAKKALEAIISHHDILRGRLCSDGIEVLPSAEREAYSFKAVSIADIDEAKEYLYNVKPDEDKFVNAVFCHSENQNLISISIHHFLVDLVSWEIIIKDFVTAVKQIKNNQEVSLPAKTASFSLWINELEKYAETISDETKKYWRGIDAKLDNIPSLSSYEEDENEAEFFTHTFDKEISAKLTGEANTAYGTRTNELLLTALGFAAGKIADSAVGIIVESHGRAELNHPIALDSTVGWFTSCYPIIIDSANNITDELIGVKDTLRRTPRNGIDYLLLTKRLHKNSDIIFNFYRADNSDHELIADFNANSSLFTNKISVNCTIRDNILMMSIAVPKCNHKKNICQDLGAEFRNQIENLIDICTSYNTVVKTCSDFSDTNLTKTEFDEIKSLFLSDDIRDIYSLTPSQEGIYARYFQSIDTKTYQLQNLCRIGKDTDLTLLKKSVELLSVRHQVLKTAFAVLKSTSEIAQVILENRIPDFSIIVKDETFSQDALDKIVSLDTEKSIDLQRDSLFRVTVIDFTDRRFMLLHTHHIILDGWCFPLLINDLQRYYSELTDGISAEKLYNEIKEEAAYQTSYAQYVSWLKNQDKNTASAYWKTLLDNCNTAHIFGREHKDTAKNEAIATFNIPLSNELGVHIESFAAELKVSLNTVFESAFSIALQKYSNSEDVIFDKVISGRSVPLKNIGSTAGTFINTVPVRIRCDKSSTIRDLIKATQEQTINANIHGTLPLTEIYKASNVDSKSIDALFVFENYYTGDLSDIEKGPLSPKLIYFKEQTEFNLTVTILKEKGIYTIRASYSEELYREREIRDFISGYISVLEKSLDGNKYIRDISLADFELTDKLNDTSAEYSKDVLIHELFQEQAEKTPDRIAVSATDKTLTYKELNEEANRIAHNLKEKGIGCGDIIGIKLPRNSSLLSAILGVLKSGAAYLPIDPELPRDRIDYMLTDSGARCCITEENFCEFSDNKNTDNPKNAIGSDDICYCIYTSGSTGKAKGTLIYHRNLAWYMASLKSLYLTDSINMPVFTSQSVDLTVTSLFLPLVTGGISYLYSGELRENLIEIFGNDNLTMIKLTPTHMDIICNLIPDKQRQNLLNVIVGGEALYNEKCIRFLNKFGNHIKIHNEYGPTETTVGCMDYIFDPDADESTVPIGHPTNNVQIYLLDKHLKLVPTGVTGELCIAGDGIGAGYLNNNELTNEKFVDNPFVKGKLYKTGDLAYLRDDCNIVYVGRSDLQVKVNGLRIELGEIENTISNIDGVVQCAVTVQNDNQDKQFICAYYTGKKKSAKLLRKEIEKALPRYMIPRTFMHLEEMPLTSSGKLDRNALPQVDFANIATGAEYQPPVTKDEIALAEAISSVLDVSNINMLDNFFNVGGDSIKAIYVISELEESGYELHVADIMQKDTLFDVAKAIKPISDKAIYNQGEVSGFIPFTPIMRAFIKENTTIPNDYVHTSIISADCDENTAKKAVDALISHHDILRGCFCDGGIKVALSSERDSYSFETVTIEDTDKAREYLHSLTFDSDKLVNIVFCKTKDQNLISVTIHHFLVDLVSWEVIIKDLVAAIKQINSGKEVSLPDKTAPFIMWSNELQKYAETISEESKTYWYDINTQLNSVKSLTSEKETNSEVQSFSYTFDKDMSDKLINVVNQTYSTRASEVLLTALGLAAGEIADGPVGIMEESHGRAELNKTISLSRTVGWFTSCYPVIVNDSNDIVAELISTKETLRRIPQNGIDYLLLSDGFHKNTDIVFNYYKTDLSVGNDDNNTVDFLGDTAFPGKINVGCIVTDNILTVNIRVPEGTYKKHVCEELGTKFIAQLEKLIDICTATDTVVKTCSDFTDSELTQAGLDELKELFGENNIEDIYSLTPSQEGIYAQYFRNTNTKTYQLHNLSVISKNADTDILRQSLELLALRHNVLKTAFAVLKSTGSIKQVILETRKPEFNIHKFDEAFSQEELDKIVFEDIENPLNLQSDSLFRVSIIDFSDKRFMLIHSHHIILDGWCLPILINDLQRYYSKLDSGIRAESLIDEIKKEAATQTSYAQYALWLKNQNKTEASEYWANLLEDYSPCHIFGKEKTNSVQKDKKATLEAILSENTTQRIENFASENKVSYNTVFESIFAVTLQKYSGSDDVVFDKIVSGRSVSLKNIENTVGPFINTVTVRIKYDENSNLADLMKESQKQTINANKYGISSLSDVYNHCGIDRKAIDALFVFENYYTGDICDIENGPLSPKVVSVKEQTEFNLTTTVVKENGRYTVKLSYSDDMYTEKEMETFLNSYVSLLSDPLNSNKLITDIVAADMSLIDEFNNTDHTYDIPADSTLYSLFEKTANENRNKICIKTANKNLTHSELLAISENLDIKIREITKGQKSIVAVIAERSIEMYATIYGIIRGGNAYLPIDPDYPKERIEYILKNSNASVVVAQSKFTHLVADIPCINATEMLNSSDSTNVIPPPAAAPDYTAYVIYTSGSTGNPKGAKVSHKSAINRILWMQDKSPLDNNSVILQKTPYTFDVSVWEIFWWGMCAGSLAASKPGEHFLPGRILDEVSKNNVTHLHFVPSVFDLFLSYLETHTKEINKFSSVRHVFLSGEALTANLIERFYKLYDSHKVTLHNLYGPTECAVDVTYYDCSEAEIDPVPIGKPIYNTQMYIVDKHLKSVPIGVTGELCIAGMNVGQGYLNNSALTDEKFIDNPFGEGKLYKTGDLAYIRDDGNIIFIGRKDSQIKLNGQRVELGEIENVISGVQGVETCAVVVRSINQSDALVAFYCGKTGIDINIKDVCREKLPKYMVPSFVVRIDKMPLNLSGKLDRNLLSKIEIGTTETQTQAPLNDIEKHICEVFEKILGEKNIGRDSDFFENGGTSYSMISLLSENGFENISAAEFMRNSSPALVAKLLSKKQSRQTQYIDALYIPKNPKLTLILLPFAGGGAESYSNFVSSLKKADENIAVYFIPYLHSVQECNEAATEIATFFEDTDILFYSHCVGSALALNIISNLEKNNVRVKHYFAGASLPPVKPTIKNIWNWVPDRILKFILTKAGANFGNLSDNKIVRLLNQFRNDTGFAGIGFSASKERIKTPTSVILSQKDPFTRGYKQARNLWETYSEAVTDISFIDSKTHYFQNDNSDELVDIVLKAIQ